MEPNKIYKLDKVVVNRIAAGEVIQRPSNALKELIENSLDAKSTRIQIITKGGGLRFLQILDNGTGVRKEDLGIVCERFTTSKLQKFEDLTSISTFGFRGEALASISHIAHLTILTKTRDEKCAFKASYQDGQLKCDIKSCAGNQGTQITIEDLFYNTPQRRQALKGVNEEFQKMYDVVCKYAVHNFNVGFILKKFGENNTIRTTPSATPIDNIRTIYGNQIANNLLTIEFDDNLLKFKLQIYATKLTYSLKKSIYLFFINNRLVDSSNLKACIEEIYSVYLPKGSHPFVYLSLEIDSNNVDVNVHPTKHEVHFLHEEEIIERIKERIEKEFVGSNEAKIFYTQARLPGASEPPKRDTNKNETEIRLYAKDLVRTDSKSQKLEMFFGAVSTSTTQHQDSVDVHSTSNNLSSTMTEVCASTFSQYKRKINKQRIETKLDSIIQLRKTIVRNSVKRLRQIISDLTFVGIVNRDKVLIQNETELFLCHVQDFMNELFFQFVIFDFGNFNTISLNNGDGLKVADLAIVYFNSEESEWSEEDGPKDDLARRVQEILIEKRLIMKEYFQLTITESGYITTLPIILENYRPTLAFLPRYIVRLATEVTWHSEIECFESFARETALFYSQIQYSQSEEEWNWTLEFVVFLAIKKYLMPPNKFSQNNSLLQIATLPNLYKVFERC